MHTSVSLFKSSGRRPPRYVHNPIELMLFTRWNGQRIGAGLIFFRKVRPCSQLHRPNTEASQIAEVHLSNRILQDEGRVRDGDPIVGANSTLHHPAFLQPGCIFCRINPRYFRPRLVNRAVHHESLESQVIVHCDLDILLRPQIAFGGLDGGVPEEELDLLQVPAILPAELGAGTAEVVGAEVLDPDLLG
jgi:hypothetical protein